MKEEGGTGKHRKEGGDRRRCRGRQREMKKETERDTGGDRGRCKGMKEKGRKVKGENMSRWRGWDKPLPGRLPDSGTLTCTDSLAFTQKEKSVFMLSNLKVGMKHGLCNTLSNTKGKLSNWSKLWPIFA